MLLVWHHSAKDKSIAKLNEWLPQVVALSWLASHAIKGTNFAWKHSTMKVNFKMTHTANLGSVVRSVNFQIFKTEIGQWVNQLNVISDIYIYGGQHVQSQNSYTCVTVELSTRGAFLFFRSEMYNIKQICMQYWAIPRQWPVIPTHGRVQPHTHAYEIIMDFKANMAKWEVNCIEGRLLS